MVVNVQNLKPVKVNSWMVISLLALVLLLTGAAIVASRNAMQDAHRELRKSEMNYLHLLNEESALQVEWVYRTNLNIVERRAREELNMRPPRPDQWRVIKP
uniref:Cell division protein FtsL n=1 Tax=Magnetococcus massalia (strain MO-1) TaxID=451514 RepID=A0A1S7LLX9_MAGMO|nr:conserved exported protein of unknown function [Candidatus Magnetococcus massalia]